jgi:hypothetical protein
MAERRIQQCTNIDHISARLLVDQASSPGGPMEAKME